MNTSNTSNRPFYVVFHGAFLGFDLVGSDVGAPDRFMDVVCDFVNRKCSVKTVSDRLYVYTDDVHYCNKSIAEACCLPGNEIHLFRRQLDETSVVLYAQVKPAEFVVCTIYSNNDRPLPRKRLVKAAGR